MRSDPKRIMILSCLPNGKILRTSSGPASAYKNLSDEEVASEFRAASDAVATERLPQTEAAYQDFARRHNGMPIYPTLADYPMPRGD